MSKTEKAVARFSEGFMCSQAVFATYSEELGVPPAFALKMAEPFGGGVCLTGETCGAVSGALMLIGLKHGRVSAEDEGARDRTVALGREMIRQFEARNGSVACKELLDCDISTDEGLAHAREQELFMQICPSLVKDAAEIAEALLFE